MAMESKQDLQIKTGLVKSLLMYLIKGQEPKEEEDDQQSNKLFHRTIEYFGHDKTKSFGCRLQNKTIAKLRKYRDTCGVTYTSLCAPIIEKFIEMHKGALDRSLPLCRNEKDVDRLVKELLNIPLVV